jgi:hypothetical protein
MARTRTKKSRRHCALRLAGFENCLLKKTYPAPVRPVKATFRHT